MKEEKIKEIFEGEIAEKFLTDCLSGGASCCGSFVQEAEKKTKEEPIKELDKDEIKEAVRKGYSKIARQAASGSGSGCGGGAAGDVSKKIGYTDGDLNAVPDGANLGLGCGNPVAFASLKVGETVLDLGSGAGFDAFLSAQRVGESGKVIGVDMTQDMIDKARKNARNYTNVEFRLGEIEHLPVADSTVDAVISNCVINLSPDKTQVFEEAFRVLKPGGRLMVSDIVLEKALPDFIKNSIEGYIGCVSGATLKEEYLSLIKAAGFQDVKIVGETNFPLDDILETEGAASVIKDLDVGAEEISGMLGPISSIKVEGKKP